MGFAMIWQSFGKALAQLGDGRFLRVVLVGIGLTIALLVAVYAAFLWAIQTFVPDTFDLPLVGSIGGVDTALGIGSLFLIIGLSIFLMVPVAAAFSGLFLDRVADAVEDRYYPTLPPAGNLGLGDTLISTINMFGVLVAVNLLAVIAYVFAGPFAPAMFLLLNGYLLGREFFLLVAERRMPRQQAKSLLRENTMTIWFAGILMATPLAMPLVNLVIPVLGAATFTHIFHRLARQGVV
jgi:CysZ protein